MAIIVRAWDDNKTPNLDQFTLRCKRISFHIKLTARCIHPNSTQGRLLIPGKIEFKLIYMSTLPQTGKKREAKSKKIHLKKIKKQKPCRLLAQKEKS